MIIIIKHLMLHLALCSLQRLNS